jgi:hypothetical protein
MNSLGWNLPAASIRQAQPSGMGISTAPSKSAATDGAIALINMAGPMNA